jgi:hypothetical protein
MIDGCGSAPEPTAGRSGPEWWGLVPLRTGRAEPEWALATSSTPRLAMAVRPSGEVVAGRSPESRLHDAPASNEWFAGEEPDREIVLAGCRIGGMPFVVGVKAVIGTVGK